MNENKIILVASSKGSDANKSSPILGKVTIRFWDSIDGKYEEDFGHLLVDSELNVVVDEGDYGTYRAKHLEPHFYKDGERIA